MPIRGLGLFSTFIRDNTPTTNPFAWSPPGRSAIKRDLRTPKYKPRVVPDRKKQASKRACRNPQE